MARKELSKTEVASLVRAAEATLGARVLKVSAPGGRKRESLRLHLSEATVIATRRGVSGAGAHEVHVLASLSPYSGALPKLLGQAGDWYFQEDVGTSRLSQVVNGATPKDQLAFARAAVEGIFDIQEAGAKAGLDRTLDRLGASQGWLASAVGGDERLASGLGLIAPALDRPALIDALSPDRTRFVKWDCRSGNAAVDPAGRLRWFDFEFAGTRHGGEDFGWLIGDEVWPVPAQEMMTVVEDAARPYGRHSAEEMDYIAVFSTIHIVQRLRLIRSEVAKRGWLGMSRILGKDDVGASPRLAIQLCDNGIFLAGLVPVLRPYGPFLTDVRAKFQASLGPQPEA